MKRIDFVLDPDGTVASEASGFTGTACEVASAAFEEALGIPKGAVKRKAKPERWQAERVGQKAGP